MQKKIRTLSIHALFGIIFLAIPFLMHIDHHEISHAYRDELHYFLILGFFYFSYFFLIDKFFLQKKYLIFSAITIISFLIITYLPGFIFDFEKAELDKFRAEKFMHQKQEKFHELCKIPENNQTFNSRPPKKPGNFELFKINHVLFVFISVVFLAVLLKIRQKMRNMEEEKVNAELSYLKSQINPHFLFNTLNSIYSLAIEKSDYTATAIVKLSGMMRYVLHKSSEEFVSLEEEINYISAYIDMQRLRFGDTFMLSYAVEGDIHSKKIAPLILIPFIENAFKHGVNAEENSCILIHIEVTDNELNFTVDNKKVKTTNDPKTRSGLGIENTKSRLNHIYPQKYSLVINEEDKDFMVSLKIELL